MSGRYLRILQSDWFRERAEFSYLLTTGMVTNYAKRRMKLQIERANFQNMTKKNKQKQKLKHWQKTNDDKNTTFPVFLNSFSYFPKIEFRNKYKFYSPTLVGRYWEKLCPRSRVRPKIERILHGNCGCTLFTHELLAYQKIERVSAGKKTNERVNTVQSTFHVVLCL